MSKSNARLNVVRDGWEKEEKRALTHDQLLDEFFTRLDRLDNTRTAIERQAEQNGEARLRLRKEMLERFAQIEEGTGLIRLLLPDTSDPVHKLIDSALDFLNQLYALAETRPTFSPDGQVSLNELVNALSISPALVRSALGVGVVWPVETKITLLADLSLKRDSDLQKPNKTTQVEEDSEDNSNNDKTND